jgi:hypothetical protein
VSGEASEQGSVRVNGGGLMEMGPLHLVLSPTPSPLQPQFSHLLFPPAQVGLFVVFQTQQYPTAAVGSRGPPTSVTS